MLGLSPLAAQTASRVQPPDVEIALTASPDEVGIMPGQPTRVWRYSARMIRGPASTVQAGEGSYLGPSIRLRRGQRVRVRFVNQIGEPSIVHWHGLDVPEAADGHPRLAVNHGAEYTYDFEVTNRAGTYWYHPHPHMRTAPQVYRGLAGVVLVSDSEEEALGLPSGRADLLCVLQDRRFDARNQLLYAEPAGPAARGRRGGGGRGMAGMAATMEQMNGWLGDRMLVNGRVQPTLDVDRRTYRVRLLNGSNARIFKLAWSDGSPMTVIGGDGGLFERVRTHRAVTLAPAQRADLLLDLSMHVPGAEVRLESVGFPSGNAGRVGMMGDPAPVPQGARLTLMTLRVSGSRGPVFGMPTRLTAHGTSVVPPASVRRIPLTFRMMNFFIDGRTFDMLDVAEDETVSPGSTHVWEFVNQPNPMGMEMAHPMHLHGRQFRVLSRAGGSANALRDGISDEGWLDTVLVLPGETVRVQVTFSNHTGLFLYHCHVLEHEDMGMMRNFRIRA